MLDGALHGDVRVLRVQSHETQVRLGDEVPEFVLGQRRPTAHVGLDPELGPLGIVIQSRRTRV